MLSIVICLLWETPSCHSTFGPDHSFVTAYPWQLIPCHLEAQLLKGGHCHILCHFFIFPFIFICSHSFLLFIFLLCTFSSLGLLHPCSGLLSMLQFPCISHALVLDHSRPILTCYCFTILAVHLSYISHMELGPLSHVVCFCTLDLCGLLLSHVFASIYFQLSFLFYYLDNCVHYLVLQSLDQLDVACYSIPLSLCSPSLWSLLLQLNSFLRYCLCC